MMLLSYTGKEMKSIMTSDVICALHNSKENEPKIPASQEKLCFGFINRTSYIMDNSGPFLFRISKGACRGEQEYEGNHLNHFYATWLLGPVLVKNPDLAEEILRLLAKERFKPYEDTLEREALKLTLRYCSSFDSKRFMKDLKKRRKDSLHKK